MPVWGEICGLSLALGAGALITLLMRGRRRGASRPGPRLALLARWEDPWVILDAEGRVVDLNPAPARSLGTTETPARGGPAAQVLSPWPAIVGSTQPSPDQAEVVLNGLPYELTVSSLGEAGAPAHWAPDHALARLGARTTLA